MKVKDIIPSPFNPRQTCDTGALAGLHASIQGAGMLHSIVVRPNPDAKKGSPPYELVCGFRRWNAERLHGGQDAEVEARVVDMTDEQVMEAQLAENGQREDIPPLEEGAALQRYAEVTGLNPGQIAERLHMSRSHVYDRFALLKLLKNGQEALRRGKISLSLALPLAQLAPGDQQYVLEQIIEHDWTVRELRTFIKTDLHRNLYEVPWDRSEGDPPCYECSRRTGGIKELTEPNIDSCLDAQCWEKHFQAATLDLIDGFKEIGEEYVLLSTKRLKPPEGALKAGRYREFEGAKEGQVPGLVHGIWVDGPQRARATMVSTDTQVIAEYEARDRKTKDAPRRAARAERVDVMARFCRPERRAADVIGPLAQAVYDSLPGDAQMDVLEMNDVVAFIPSDMEGSVNTELMDEEQVSRLALASVIAWTGVFRGDNVAPALERMAAAMRVKLG